MANMKLPVSLGATYKDGVLTIPNCTLLALDRDYLIVSIGAPAETPAPAEPVVATPAKTGKKPAAAAVEPAPAKKPTAVVTPASKPAAAAPAKKPAAAPVVDELEVLE